VIPSHQFPHFSLIFPHCPFPVLSNSDNNKQQQQTTTYTMRFNTILVLVALVVVANAATWQDTRTGLNSHNVQIVHRRMDGTQFNDFKLHFDVDVMPKWQGDWLEKNSDNQLRCNFSFSLFALVAFDKVGDDCPTTFDSSLPMLMLNASTGDQWSVITEIDDEELMFDNCSFTGMTTTRSVDGVDFTINIYVRDLDQNQDREECLMNDTKILHNSLRVAVNIENLDDWLGDFQNIALIMLMQAKDKPTFEEKSGDSDSDVMKFGECGLLEWFPPMVNDQDMDSLLTSDVVDEDIMVCTLGHGQNKTDVKCSKIVFCFEGTEPQQGGNETNVTTAAISNILWDPTMTILFEEEEVSTGFTALPSALLMLLSMSLGLVFLA